MHTVHKPDFKGGGGGGQGDLGWRPMAFKLRRSDEPANVSLIACGASVSVGGCTAWKMKRIKEGGLNKERKMPGSKTVRREVFAN